VEEYIERLRKGFVSNVLPLVEVKGNVRETEQRSDRYDVALNSYIRKLFMFLELGFLRSAESLVSIVESGAEDARLFVKTGKKVLSQNKKN
jgi:hypothetical protein